jgi:ABC-type lipoprotein release transport system permease subunit
MQTWVKADLRHRVASTVALVLLIGLSAGISLTALAGSRRTDTAYDRFLESSRSATHRVQYTPDADADADVDEEVLEQLAADPAIDVVVPVHFLIGFTEASPLDISMITSPEPAFLRDIDRLDLVAGRTPTPSAADEVLVNQTLARSAGLQPGDQLQLATFTPKQIDEEDFESGPQGPPLDLLVTGVGRNPDDLADDQSPFVFGGPAFFEATEGEVGGHGPSLEILGGPDADVRAAVDRAFERVPLKEALLVEGVEIRSDRVRDATGVLSTGLLLFAACAAMASIVVASQALGRRLASQGPDQLALSAMGATRLQRLAGVLLAAAPAIVGGASVAVAVAVLGSWWMPIGLARRAEPNLGLSFDAVTLGVGALALVSALLATTALSGRRLTRSSGPGAGAAEPASLRRSTGAAVAERAGSSPPTLFGITMALEPGRGRTAVPVRPALIGAVAGVAGVVAALTFGSSLGHFVDTPSAYGFNWHLSPDLFDDQPEQLAARSEVEDVGLLLFRQTTVEGEDIDGMAVLPVKGNPSLTVLDGRMPRTTGEIALGPKTMEQLDARIGARLEATSAQDEPIEVEVVGEVLFPTFDDNPFNEGMAFHPDLAADVARSDGFGQAMVSFRPGVDLDEAEAIVEEVAPDSITVYARPSRPPDVANLAQVRRMPLALAAFLVVLAVAAVVHALVVAVRRRRRDLGVVRAIGFLRQQVRSSIVVQAVTLVVVGLLAGIPLGIVLGRTAWAVVANGMGVGASPDVPTAAVGAMVPIGVVLAALAAVLPARSAARLRTTEALSAE